MLFLREGRAMCASPGTLALCCGTSAPPTQKNLSRRGSLCPRYALAGEARSRCSELQPFRRLPCWQLGRAIRQSAFDRVVRVPAGNTAVDDVDLLRSVVVTDGPILPGSA